MINGKVGYGNMFDFFKKQKNDDKENIATTERITTKIIYREYKDKKTDSEAIRYSEYFYKDKKISDFILRMEDSFVTCIHKSNSESEYEDIKLSLIITVSPDRIDAYVDDNGISNGKKSMIFKEAKHPQLRSSQVYMIAEGALDELVFAMEEKIEEGEFEDDFESEVTPYIAAVSETTVSIKIEYTAVR